jgi:hypothetical protein
MLLLINVKWFRHVVSRFKEDFAFASSGPEPLSGYQCDWLSEAASFPIDPQIFLRGEVGCAIE